MMIASLIYILVHETNHLNRFFNNKGEFLKGHLTPRNKKCEDFLNEPEPEGGRYICATLFKKNLSSLNLKQAEFIIDESNWNPPDNEERKYVEIFRNNFSQVENMDNMNNGIASMRMMENHLDKKIIDTVCLRPNN